MVYLNNISLVLPKKWEGKESACAGNWVSVIKCCMSLKYNVGGPLKHIVCMENTDVTSPSSLKLVTAPFFNITFFYFLVCRFFRHPASRWLRYTGCLLSFRLKESLSPPDLVSLRSVVQGWKNECRTHKWRWRKNGPPVYEIQGKDQVKMSRKQFTPTANGGNLLSVQWAH